MQKSFPYRFHLPPGSYKPRRMMAPLYLEAMLYLSGHKTRSFTISTALLGTNLSNFVPVVINSCLRTVLRNIQCAHETLR